MSKLSVPIAALTALVTAITLSPSAHADGHTITIDVNLTNATGIGAAVGTVTLEDTDYGLLLTPELTNLTPGLHGFHIHTNPSCEPGLKNGKVVPGLGAGGHFDPFNTGVHAGPYGDGHLGDLPPLFVAEDGTATVAVLAPRLETDFIHGRALMIHMHGDNFSDEPAALGGGGSRLACGVIE